MQFLKRLSVCTLPLYTRILLFVVAVIIVINLAFTNDVQAGTEPKNPILNSDFTEASGEEPLGWMLAEGKGDWKKDGILQVTGNGEDAANWRSEPIPFQAGQLYQLSTRMRKVGNRGIALAGTTFASYDHRDIAEAWTEVTQVFRVPEGVTEAQLRLGHWHADGQVEFDSVKLAKVVPIHFESEGTCLGRGENILGDQYTFNGNFDGLQGPCHRTFVAATAQFNTNRWCMIGGNTLTYRFDSPEGRFTEARVEANVCHHGSGTCLIEASLDGKTWEKIGQIEEVKQSEFSLPTSMLPAKTIFLRAKAEGTMAYLQLDKLAFSAKFERSQTSADLAGKTILASLPFDEDTSGIESVTFSEDYRVGKLHFYCTFKEHSPEATLSATAAEQLFQGESDPKVPKRWCVAVDMAGGRNLPIELRLSSEGKSSIVMKTELTLPEFYRADYGERFSLSADATGAENTAVWWCRADHKVPRFRRLPQKEATAVKLAAAKNDRESVQVIVAPKETLQGFQAEIGDFTGPDGATIPASNVKILRAYYHRVHTPTDSTGLADWWPDALPPLDAPFDVAAAMNQPIWLVVHVPEEATAGEYTAQLHLTAKELDATIPVQLTVWNYALPKQNHITTAFGFSPWEAFRYHGVKTEEDQRKLMDLYFQSFSEHRISPYDPTPLDPIGVTFDPKSDPPSATVDFSRFDAAMEQAVSDYNFNGFQLPVQGMGGGTFHSRDEPQIHGFKEETPEYKAMFSSYVEQLQNHLKEKGWLDMAYIYWFDEPAPKDYEFVSRGMSRLKRYAPELPTMLTVHMEPDNQLRDIDIWCPISSRYDMSMPGLAKDHTVWWYVCTGPQAPYCTLFIDHPATDLRVWHWQAWKRNIVGSLVWQSNYWTSSAAFPDKAQNPYEDPMAYVSGYSTPKGVKRLWGNGDGRFLYPPLAAAEPGISGEEPVLAPPVSSIRWEMLREGIEDWESLYLLRERIAAKRETLSPETLREAESLLTVPESISVDMTHFTTDPEPIYTHREKVARMIEKLSK